jgi:cytochrome c oxidase subunit 2
MALAEGAGGSAGASSSTAGERRHGINRMRLPAFVLIVAAMVPAAPADPPGDPPGTRSFEVVASRFKFEPDVFEVDEGDRVVIRVHSADTAHGLAIKEFKVKKDLPDTGEEITVEFVAAKAGTFRMECSEYCGKGHSKMRGRLVVRPKAR